MQKKVSLRDVAKHCNVSAMTVSCVVRQVDCVKESTRIRVEAAIQELGYRADPTLRALALYRKRSINESGRQYKSTLAFFDSEPSEYSRSMYQHCHQEGQRLGYELKYYEQPRTRQEQATFSKRLWSQGIRGVLLGPAQREFDLQGFQFERFAMVSIGALQHSPAVDSVCSDYFQGLYMAAQHCLDYGYKRIGFFLVSYLEARTGHRWLGAYNSFCQHYQKKPFIWIYENGKPPEPEAIAAWLKKYKLDAVFTLAEFIPDDVAPDLRRIFLNDWHVGSDAWRISTPQNLIAQESLRLLDDYLIHQKYGVPQWPRQISIKPIFTAAEISTLNKL